MKMNLLVIGAGLMGKTHLEMYSKIAEIGSIGVFDIDESKRIEITSKLSDVQFENNLIEALYHKPNIVSICTPPYTHFELLREIINNGIKNILVEKPMLLTLEEAECLENIMPNDIRLMIGMVERFNPPYMNARNQIMNGYLGKIKFIESTRLMHKPSYTTWYSDNKKSGGPIFDLGIHDIDVFQWLLNDTISEIYINSKNSIKDTSYDLHIIFKSDMAGRCVCGYRDNSEVSLKIEGEKKNIILDTETINNLRYPYAYLGEIRYFVHSVLANSDVSPNFYDGKKFLEYLKNMKLKA